MVSDVHAASTLIRDVIESACAGLVQREIVVQVVVLASVAQEHVLLIGPPGTAKSEAVRRIARGLGGQTFEYLLGRFTEPSELFGPVDLRKLRDAVVETRTEGMLPEADFAFLDEVFLGSTAILNTLLGILNERTFRRGHTHIQCPLRVCVGASNQLPEDPALAAFADRFMVQLFLEPIEDPYLEQLLERGWNGAPASPPSGNALAALDQLSATARSVDLAGVRPLIAEAVRTLREAGVELSDRRIVRLQRLIAAAAVLDGRLVANASDLWPIIFAVPKPGQQAMARTVLHTLLETSTSHALTEAAEEASAGRLARAQRLSRSAESLLQEQPATDDQDLLRRWRLALEGVAREIDATFAEEERPAPLDDIRQRIAHAIQAVQAPA